MQGRERRSRRRRALPWAAAAALLLAPAGAAAGDLGSALGFAKDIMGEDAIEGWESYLEEAPDESLAQILFQSGTIDTNPYQTLGTVRLGLRGLQETIMAASRRYQVPPALIDAVIRTESGYRPQAVSRTGAKGLMQLMPRTAAAMGVRDAFDPAQNIMGGTRYLARLLKKFKSLRLAVAAYNAGPGNVRKYKGVPPFKETRRYVKTVMLRYQHSKLGDAPYRDFGTPRPVDRNPGGSEDELIDMLSR